MNQQLTTGREFALEFNEPANKATITEFMPDEKDLKRFTAVVFRAVKEKPELLDADRTSMFLACQRAAQDGLMPDNREGALVIYNTKVGDDWVKKVQWQPMIQGIRKKLANHNFDMQAEIVYKNDTFEYHKGDSPHILHVPAPFGTEKGPMIGAYAIATNLTTGEKYREVMDLAQLEQVRAISKNSSGGAWKSFTDEMHRKTPAKRLMKYLPLIETDIFDLVSRDNEQFDFSKPTGASQTAKKVQEAVRAGNAKPAKPAPIEGEVVDPKPVSAKPKPVAKSAVPESMSPEEIASQEQQADAAAGAPLAGRVQAAPVEEEEPDPLGF